MLNKQRVVSCIAFFQLSACGSGNVSLKKNKYEELGSVALNETTKPNESTVKNTAKSESNSEGGQTSGGGPGIICRNSAGSILSVESLDLYEGRILRGLSYPAQIGDRDTIVSRMVNRFSFDEAIKRDLPRAIARVVEQWQALPTGVSIHPSADFGTDYAVVKPESCSIELVGYYEKDGKLMVAPSLYSAMNPTHQAAFLLHEALYYMARDFSGAKESKAVRELVASLFSSATEEDLRSRSRLVTWGSGTIIKVLNSATTSKIKISVKNPSSDIYFNVSVSCRGPKLLETGGDYFQITPESPHSFIIENPQADKKCRAVFITVGGWTVNTAGSVKYSGSFSATSEDKEFASGAFGDMFPGFQSAFPAIALYFE